MYSSRNAPDEDFDDTGVEGARDEQQHPQPAPAPQALDLKDPTRKPRADTLDAYQMMIVAMQAWRGRETRSQLKGMVPSTRSQNSTCLKNDFHHPFFSFLMAPCSGMC